MEFIRIIPKIDIKNENVIKGIQFEGLRKVGNPNNLAKKYFNDGADQIIVIDIVASLYDRDNLYSTLDTLTEDIFIPITAGGGIRSLNDAKKLLLAGADKVSINTAALEDPNIIDRFNKVFGDQFLSVTIEAKKLDGEFYCMKNHGRDNSEIKVVDWIEELKKKSISEIILISIDKDGLQEGPDYELLKKINEKKLNFSLIYGGGLEKNSDILEVLHNYNLSGITLSTALHFQKNTIGELKKFLKKNKIKVNAF